MKANLLSFVRTFVSALDRSKLLTARSTGRAVASMLLAALMVSTCAAAVTPQAPKHYINTTYALPSGGQTWAVHTGDDFKAALKSALPGDVILLDAGVTYSGNFNLPAKDNPLGKWIYIMSAPFAQATLPKAVAKPASRINPATALPYMATITTPNMTAAITAVPGANHYRLVGLEIRTDSTVGCNASATPVVNCSSYQIVHVAGENVLPTDVPGQPDSITIDRCYIHGSDTQDATQGVLANGTNIALVDSYVSDIHNSTWDSQGFLAYAAPGPFKVTDNYVSATTENVMFGGAGGANNPYVPSDIEIRNNWLYKPMTWAQVGVTIPPQNQWVEKNLLEFKSGQRAVITNNTLENSWVSGQVGYAVLFTSRTGQSGNIAHVDDIDFENNTLKNVVNGFEILYHDYNCGTTYPNCTNPGEARRIKIKNNLILFSDPNGPGGANNIGAKISKGTTDLLIQHNTFLGVGNGQCYQSVFFDLPSSPTSSDITHNVWILDNMLCAQPSGNGVTGPNTINNDMSDPSPADNRFAGNMMYDAKPVTGWPAHNMATAVQPAFDNRQVLLTPYFTDTTDGLVAGKK